MTKKSLILIISLPIFSFLVLVIYLQINVNKITPGITKYPLHNKSDMFVYDLCYVNKEIFAVFQNDFKVYKLENNMFVPFFGDFGTGESRFMAPTKIKYNNGLLYIVDLENRQAQSFDTSGKFVSAFPARTNKELLFLSGQDRYRILSNIEVNNDFIFFFIEDGGNLSTIFKMDKKSLNVSKIRRDLPVINYSILNDSVLFFVSNYTNTLYKTDMEGKLITSTGLQGRIMFKFGAFKGLEVDTKGNVFVLEIVMGADGKPSPFGVVHQFDLNLRFKKSYGKTGSTYNILQPGGMVLIESIQQILVLNGNASVFYQIDL